MPASIECEFCHSNDDSGEKESYFCSQEHLDLHRDPGKSPPILKSNNASLKIFKCYLSILKKHRINDVTCFM